MPVDHLVRLVGNKGAGGLLVPIWHIQAVETRAREPYVLVGGRRVDVTQKAAEAVAALVEDYWGHGVTGKPDPIEINIERQYPTGGFGQFPDGLGDRGA